MDSSADELRKLFQACDLHQRGYIDREEFAELCTSFHIDQVDADIIFCDLDRDGDQRINLQDFTSGFRDFLTIPAHPHKKNVLKKQATEKAWKLFTDRVGQHNIERFLNSSAAHLHGFYEELQQCEDSERLIWQLENLVESVVFDACQHERERLKFDEAIRKEREQHQEHLKLLEEELELQMQRVATVAKKEAETKFEAEKRNLQLKLESEITQLQTHLRIFQKVENWLDRDQQLSEMTREQQEAWGQLDKASHENRHLKMTLVDAQATLALLQTELSQVKSHYEEKCRILQSERDVGFDLTNHHELLQRKLELLHEANRNLQDTNDSLRAQHEFLSPRRSPIGSSIAINRHISRQEDLRSLTPSLMDEAPEGASNSGSNSFVINEFNELGEMRIFDFSGPSSLQSELKVTTGTSSSLQNELKMNYLALNGVKEKPASISRPDMEATGAADRTFRIVFAGDAAVGKSTFITRLHQGIFTVDNTTTLGVDFKVKTIRINERNVAVQLWDTAGQERFRSLTRSYFRKADGVMLLFDVTCEQTFLNIRHWMQCIGDSHERSVPLILCGTKADLRLAAENDGVCCVSHDHAFNLAKELEARYLETSAKTGANIFEAFVSLTRQMMIVQDEEVETSALRLTENDQEITSCCISGKSKNRCA